MGFRIILGDLTFTLLTLIICVKDSAEPGSFPSLTSLGDLHSLHRSIIGPLNTYTQRRSLVNVEKSASVMNIRFCMIPKWYFAKYG